MPWELRHQILGYLFHILLKRGCESAVADLGTGYPTFGAILRPPFLIIILSSPS